MFAWESPIIRVSAGRLNMVNDSVIGGQPGLGSSSKFAGQLGKMLAVSQDQIGLLSNSSVGTLYAGVYQYVRFATSDTAPVIGQACFWQGSVGDFIVSTDSNGGLTDTPRPAGFFISIPTAGNYCFIQIAGVATLRFKAGGLTVAGATGQPVIVASTGLADTNAGTNVPNFVGTTIALPVTDTATTVQLASELMARA